MSKPFAENMRYVQGGTFMDGLADQLSELITTVDTHGKPGELILKIKVKRVSGSALGITPTIELKLPKEKPDESLLYATPEGNLSPDHPKQQSLGLQVAPSDRPASFQTAA
jgi:hypothetical protein